MESIEYSQEYELQYFRELTKGGYYRKNKSKLPNGIFYNEIAFCIIDELKPLTHGNEIFIYNKQENCFVDAEDSIKKYVVNNFTASATIHTCEEVIHFLKNNEHIKETANKKVIYLKNGVFDFDTWEFIENTDEKFEWYISHCFGPRINVKFSKEEDCPKFKKFINEVVDEKDAIILYEFIAYSLYPDIFLNEFVVLYGSGANGKSTFLNVLSEFLGRENVSNISLQNFEENRFHTHLIKNKLVNIYSDLPATAIQQISTIKAITGGDEIIVEQKFKTPHKIKNKAKLIFACNQIPLVYEDSDAFFRRIIIIDFPNQFVGEKADPFILEKITTEQEKSGLFNEALKHLKRLLEIKRFSYTYEIDERREIYLRRTDPVKYFIENNIQKSPQSQVYKKEIYDAYVVECEKLKVKNILNEKIFWKKFKKLCEYEYNELRPFRSERVIQGIKLKNSTIKQEIIDINNAENEDLKYLRVYVHMVQDLKFSIASSMNEKVHYPPLKAGDICEMYLRDAEVYIFRGLGRLIFNKEKIDQSKIVYKIDESLKSEGQNVKLPKI